MNALEFATKAHKGAFRWDGITPYIEHPKAVVKLLESFNVHDKTILDAAYLHDVIEDTDVTSEEIKKEFGIDVALTVMELTRGIDANYMEHTSKLSTVAGLIKIADILCNLTDSSSPKSKNFIRKRLEALAMLQEKQYYNAI